MEIKYRRQGMPIETKIKIVTDYNANMPIKNIMAKYSTTRTTIYNILKEMAN